MHHSKIALGSMSPFKYTALAMVLESSYGYSAKIIPLDVKSGVSRQPFGLEEMLRGAQNRAHSALAAEPSASFSLGIESGIEQIGDTYFDSTIAVITHPTLGDFIGKGPGFQIPSWAVEEAHESELGEVVMRRGADHKDASAYFTDNMINRLDMLTSAVKYAYGRFFWKHRFHKDFGRSPSRSLEK